MAEKKTIQQQFEAFDQNNPQIWHLIVQQVERALKAGRKKIGMKSIIEWIRWEKYVETKEDNQTKLFGKDKVKLKINNVYTSRYARKLIAMYPAYEKFIETRELKAK